MKHLANLETIGLTKEALERIIEAGRKALEAPIQYFPPPLAALRGCDPWSPAGRAAAMRERLLKAGIATTFDMIWRSR